MQGTMVIALSPDGRVQGCVADFDQSKSGGVDLRDVQARRAKIRLSGDIIRDHCSEHLYKALTRDTYTAQKVMDGLRDEGWRFEVRQIETSDDKGPNDA